MRVLAHIHTLNAAGVIEHAVQALERQTRPPDAIIIVDNGSTDGTLDRPFPERVTIIRNPVNVGVSGSVRVGMTYALEHDFDWIWVLDADSAAQPDALEKLLDLYAGWPEDLQQQTAFLAGLSYNLPDGQPLHGQRFTGRGIDIAWPPPDQRHYRVDAAIWSGCLYRLAAVRQIGLPNPDYFMDAGDCAYGYVVMKAGYKGFIDRDAVLQHNVHGTASFARTTRKLGPFSLTAIELPPLRCYYGCRNTLYFALYDYDSPQGRSRLLLRTMFGLATITANFLLRPRTHGEQILACFRGMWHGVTGNIAARY